MRAEAAGRRVDATPACCGRWTHCHAGIIRFVFAQALAAKMNTPAKALPDWPRLHTKNAMTRADIARLALDAGRRDDATSRWSAYAMTFTGPTP